ncbi:hypothetical protein QYS48_28335 [Marivirga arenosa]|uniref:Uncharacterized protein n=1 Tax=Marivirga arenosa TaxID=3059076 RepID=A0AA51RD21_9BACT|nr:hypothetical protein [Marivirga sp. ABR2-2]WMN07264.1 hypothetical protein QYS48_28335 [Marivirga sp. ABR2-2]
MTIEKIPYFLTFKDLNIILSDYGKKNINISINEDILDNSNVHIDDNFLSKRYQLLTDYPVIYFTNSNLEVFNKKITAATFDADI